MRPVSDIYEGFSFYIKRSKNDFKGNYFMENQEKYFIEDEKGVCCTE